MNIVIKICFLFSNLAFVQVCVSDQLLLAYKYVSKYVDCGWAVDVLYFDYRKAFDVVNQSPVDKIIFY